LELGIWIAAAIAGAAAVLRWYGAVPQPVESGAVTYAQSASPRRVAPDSLAAAAAVLVEHDLFRLERRPSDVAYSPDLEGAPLPEAAPPKPVLVLKGLVGGPPWQAVLEGIPGREGSVVVRTGDTLGALRVRAIRRDTVVVQGMDTTWRMTVKRGWQ